MAATYVPLATTTLGSASATVTFSSIPSTYTDLVLIFNCLSTWTADNGPRCYINLNNDSGTNYSVTTLRGNGTSASSTRETDSYTLFPGRPNPSYNSNTSPSTIICHFNNYSNTTTYKTVISRYNALANGDPVGANVNLWRNTAAINRIDLTTNGDWASGSTFTLYGILAA